MLRQRKARIARTVAAGLFSVLAPSGPLSGQCLANRTDSAQHGSEIEQFFNQKNWAEVARLAEPMATRSADVNFEYGLALAHLQQWPQARAALRAGERECPRQKRFSLELAGVAFEEKQYAEAAMWLRRALQIDPRDDYANDFAGTVYLLMGNTNTALKYWNRVRKPYIGAVDFDPHLRVQRLILDRAFAFSPAAVLKQRDFETTEARLDRLGIFPRHKVVLNARADGNFDAEFHAQEQNGFGSTRAQALVATFSGAAYQTVYPSYFNIAGSATNVDALLRWDAQKRRAWISVSAPLHDLPQFRWQFDVDAHNENWAIRRSFTGTAPVLGSLNLQRQAVTGSVVGIPDGRVQWSMGGEFSHRTYRSVVDGTALTPALAASGYELKVVASIEDKVLNIPERRFWLTAGAGSELARMWPSQPQLPNAPDVFGKLHGWARVHWFPQAQNDTYEATGSVRAAGTFGNAPFDELFLLGMERDTDLKLRGQVGTRDGKKGSSPLGTHFFLVNGDFYRRIYGNGLFDLSAGPLADIARAGAPASELANGEWLFDVGVAAKVTILGTSIVLTYGRDPRSASGAFYGTVMR